MKGDLWPIVAITALLTAVVGGIVLIFVTDNGWWSMLTVAAFCILYAGER